MKTRSALSYFGSDSEVAAELAAKLDHCRHVTIPFVGGASIIPHLEARAIVANDLNSLAINFYRVVSGLCGEHLQAKLIEWCRHTLSHPDEIKYAESMLDPSNSTSTKLERAWAYWAVCWIGRKGKGGTTSMATMPSVRRTATGGTNASRLRAAANDLQAWAKHFERCEWESVCFRELLPKVADDPKCAVYADPPWRGAGDIYLHSFSEQCHIDLARMLSRFKRTTVVVRYGDDQLIRELYKGWTIEEAKSRTQAGSDCGEIWLSNK